MNFGLLAPFVAPETLSAVEIHMNYARGLRPKCEG
jgi:hypothetical protein